MRIKQRLVGVVQGLDGPEHVLAIEPHRRERIRPRERTQAAHGRGAVTAE